MTEEDFNNALSEIARLVKVGRMYEQTLERTSRLPTKLSSDLEPKAGPGEVTEGFVLEPNQKFVAIEQFSFCEKGYNKGDLFEINSIDGDRVTFNGGLRCALDYFKLFVDQNKIVRITHADLDGPLLEIGQRYDVTRDIFDNMGRCEFQEKEVVTIEMVTKEDVYLEGRKHLFRRDRFTYLIGAGLLELREEMPFCNGEEFSVKEFSLKFKDIDYTFGRGNIIKVLDADTPYSDHRIRIGRENYPNDCWLVPRQELSDFICDGKLKVVETWYKHDPFNFKEGQVYRVKDDVPSVHNSVMFHKNDTIKIDSVDKDYVIILLNNAETRQFHTEIFERIVKYLVLEDEEIVVKPGHKYRVTRDIKSNFTDELRHKEGEILEVTHVDEAYVSYRTGETNMRESADKFRHLIALETLVLVGSEFKGEMSCEFKDGMKFKFSKEFARVCGVPGNDFHPGDTISIIPINRTDIAIINDRGYNTGTVKIEWLRERIKDGTLVPFADDQTSGSDDDMCFYDGEKFVVQMSFEFLSPKDDKTWHHLDKDQIITIGVNRDAPADEQISLYRDANLLCYISRSTLIRLIQHDRLKVKED